VEFTGPVMGMAAKKFAVGVSLRLVKSVSPPQTGVEKHTKKVPRYQATAPVPASRAYR
jgi:hypothetical protein